jgi:hypothetical protein
MSFRFTADHFSNNEIFDGRLNPEQAAHMANAVLDIEENKLPLVKGRMVNNDPQTTWWSTFEVEGEEPCTHRARLWNIQDVKNEDAR